jgi:hypothetical protein
VGAADGAPGLPGTGWSREHGDLRVPHFLGLHAMQLLPLLAIALGRRRPAETTVRLTLTAAASYSALFILLLWQALRGQPLVQPDGLTTASLGIWLALTAAAVWIAAPRGDRRGRRQWRLAAGLSGFQVTAKRITACRPPAPPSGPTRPRSAAGAG